MSTRRPRASRPGRFSLSVPSRRELIKIVDELQPRRPQISFLARTRLLQLLMQIIDQMPPRRDPRVNLGAWQIAMLAAALVDERNERPKQALLAAMEICDPQKANDAKFRTFIERTYRKLRAGKNPARSFLLPVPPEMLALARAQLRKK